MTNFKAPNKQEIAEFYVQYLLQGYTYRAEITDTPSHYRIQYISCFSYRLIKSSSPTFKPTANRRHYYKANNLYRLIDGC